MKRFHDYDSDRYHTAIAASLMCVLVAGTFLLVASLALRIELTRPALYFGALLLLAGVVQLAGWHGWHGIIAWLRTAPWRSRPRETVVYRWKKAALPPPEEKITPRSSAESTWHAGGEG